MLAKTKARSARPAQVLVVDDSPTVLRVVEGVLSQAGYGVTCLESARDVIEIARRLQPDLMFVDFAMPEINGFAVCRAFGEHADLETIPIVLMNTRGDPIGERFVREMGIVDHITKPFAPAALLAVVEHTLAKVKGTDPGARRRVSAEAIEPEGTTPAPDSRALARRRLASLLAARIDATRDGDDVAVALEAALADAEIADAAQQALALEPPQPALAGNLADIPIAEVMQLLALQRQTGILRVQQGGTHVSIALEKGALRLVTGVRVPVEFLLGSILVVEGLVDEDELAVFLKNRRGSRRRLGTQLVKLGYLDKEQLHRALRRQTAELMYEMLRWGRGEFLFEPLDALPNEVLEVELDLSIDEVLMEGFRRVDEWGLIESAIPSFDLVPECVPGGIERLGEQGLTVNEQKVYDAIDGKRTVDEVIRAAGLGTFEAARRLYRLVSAHVVRIDS